MTHWGLPQCWKDVSMRETDRGATSSPSIAGRQYITPNNETWRCSQKGILPRSEGNWK